MMNLKKSFTLVEMSIVLAVITILLGIVLTGSKLIDNARVVRIINEISQYRESIDTFYKLFNAYPGDYDNAQYSFAPTGYSSSSWSEIINNNDLSQIIPHNGNQDGIVSNKILHTEDGVYYSEVFGVWSHLSSYNLIDKKYSNICYNNSSEKCVKSGYNLPIISGGYNNYSVYMFYQPDLNSSNDKNLLGQIFNENDTKSKNVLLMLDISHSYNYDKTKLDTLSYVLGGGGGVKSNFMMQIDNKIDDGKPMSGNVFGLNGSNEDNRINTLSKTGQCNSYKGSNLSKPSDVKNIVYSNDENQSCIGVIVFN